MTKTGEYLEDTSSILELIHPQILTLTSDQWNELVVYAKVDSAYLYLRCMYLMENGEKKEMECNEELYRLFTQLFSLSQACGDPWVGALYKINDGKFNIEYYYADEAGYP